MRAIRGVEDEDLFGQLVVGFCSYKIEPKEV